MIEHAPGIFGREPLEKSYADDLLANLPAEMSLSQQILTFNGREVPMPRLTGWYGEPDAVYTYSGLRNVPNPWTPSLLALRKHLEMTLETPLNSCLANLYRDGSDSIGWHSDNEPELDKMIVSISLGAERTFEIKPNGTKIQSSRLLGWFMDPSSR